MDVTYVDEVYECLNCEKDTKRINITLSMPSCCQQCDKDLQQNYNTTLEEV